MWESHCLADPLVAILALQPFSLAAPVICPHLMCVEQQSYVRKPGLSALVLAQDALAAGRVRATDTAEEVHLSLRSLRLTVRSISTTVGHLFKPTTEKQA